MVSRGGGQACPSCGRPADAGDHSRCSLDPPRFCPTCGRRLKVQVFPDGYRATCLGCAAGGRPT